MRYEQTSKPVYQIGPDLETRFRWRALRRCRKLNAVRTFPTYRWEPLRMGDRWVVTAFQNVAVPATEHEAIQLSKAHPR